MRAAVRQTVGTAHPTAAPFPMRDLPLRFGQLHTGGSTLPPAPSRQGRGEIVAWAGGETTVPTSHFMSDVVGTAHPTASRATDSAAASKTPYVSIPSRTCTFFTTERIFIPVRSR